MSPELASRLRVLEQQAEALALQATALRQQVTALVSEAEHEAHASEAGPALVTDGKEPERLQFYGQGPVTDTKEATDAPARPSRTRRSP